MNNMTNLLVTFLVLTGKVAPAKRREAGQGSLEYVGMIAVAAIIIVGCGRRGQCRGSADRRLHHRRDRQGPGRGRLRPNPPPQGEPGEPLSPVARPVCPFQLRSTDRARGERHAALAGTADPLIADRGPVTALMVMAILALVFTIGITALFAAAADESSSAMHAADAAALAGARGVLDDAPAALQSGLHHPGRDPAAAGRRRLRADRPGRRVPAGGGQQRHPDQLLLQRLHRHRAGHGPDERAATSATALPRRPRRRRRPSRPASCVLDSDFDAPAGRRARRRAAARDDDEPPPPAPHDPRPSTPPSTVASVGLTVDLPVSRGAGSSFWTWPRRSGPDPRYLGPPAVSSEAAQPRSRRRSAGNRSEAATARAATAATTQPARAAAPAVQRPTRRPNRPAAPSRSRPQAARAAPDQAAQPGPLGPPGHRAARRRPRTR